MEGICRTLVLGLVLIAGTAIEQATSVMYILHVQCHEYPSVICRNYNIIRIRFAKYSKLYIPIEEVYYYYSNSTPI